MALLDQGEGSRVDAPLAYVAVGLAYSRRSLWEIEQEMYDRIASRGRDEAHVEVVHDFVTRVISYNQRESCAAWSCALFEAGDREAAAAVARRGLATPDAYLPDMPEGWQCEIRAIDSLLVALAGNDPRQGEPTEEDLFEDTAWAGTRGFMALAAAVRHHDLGDVGEAARLSDVAVNHFDVDLVPSARLLAMAIRAQAVSNADVQAYLRTQATLRWQSRLQLLGAARSRIGVEGMALDHDRLRRPRTSTR